MITEKELLIKLYEKFGENYKFKIIETNIELLYLSKVEVMCIEHKAVTLDLVINLLHKDKPCLECLKEDNGIEKEVMKKRKKRSSEELIIEFKEKHGESKFMYHDIPFSFRTMNEKVWIKCIKHNYFFEQTPNNHLNTQICCPKCLEEFNEFSNSNDT